MNAAELRTMAADHPHCLQEQRRYRQVVRGQLPGNFEEYDTDGNGEISWKEFSDQLDKANDGNIPVNAFRTIIEKIAGCKNLQKFYRVLPYPNLHCLYLYS